MRLRNIPGVEQLLLDYPTFVQHPANYKGIWHHYFQNHNPIHLEIGCGKGQFINTLATQYPDCNFIALELKAEVIYRAVQRTDKQPINNLAFIQYDASQLTDLFNKNEISRIYLNFSDPWPKRRHYKRRLTHASFLQVYKQILASDGEIHLKTDNEQLFEFSLNQLSNESFRLRHITFDLHRSEHVASNIMTEYEQRFAERGQRIYRTEALCPTK